VQRDRHLASGDLCRKGAPLGQCSRASLLVAVDHFDRSCARARDDHAVSDASRAICSPLPFEGEVSRFEEGAPGYIYGRENRRGRRKSSEGRNGGGEGLILRRGARSRASACHLCRVPSTPQPARARVRGMGDMPTNRRPMLRIAEAQNSPPVALRDGLRGRRRRVKRLFGT
jgi:hypothetical protein